MEIKRYEDELRGMATLIESETGEYVKYSDYQNLLEKHNRLKKFIRDKTPKNYNDEDLLLTNDTTKYFKSTRTGFFDWFKTFTNKPE